MYRQKFKSRKWSKQKSSPRRRFSTDDAANWNQFNGTGSATFISSLSGPD
jgi:hypothetical protein